MSIKFGIFFCKNLDFGANLADFCFPEILDVGSFCPWNQVSTFWGSQIPRIWACHTPGGVSRETPKTPKTPNLAIPGNSGTPGFPGPEIPFFIKCCKSPQMSEIVPKKGGSKKCFYNRFFRWLFLPLDHPTGLGIDVVFGKGISELGGKNRVFRASRQKSPKMAIFGVSRKTPKTRILANFGDFRVKIGKSYQKTALGPPWQVPFGDPQNPDFRGPGGGSGGSGPNLGISGNPCFWGMF